MWQESEFEATTSYNQAESYLLHLLSSIKLPWQIVLGWSLLASLVGLLIMVFDKGRAERGEWRFSEKLLMEIAYSGGCWGVGAGMILFDHKTENPLFMALEGGAVLLWYIALTELVALIGLPIQHIT